MAHTRVSSKTLAKSHSTSKQGRATKGLKDIRVDEVIKISVNLALERFRYSDEKEMEFPSSFTNIERAFVHRIAQSLGYISKSKGSGAKRYLTIRKSDGSEKPQPTLPLALSHNTLYFIRTLLEKFPITSKEHAELQLSSDSGLMIGAEADNSCDRNGPSGRLNKGVPLVPRRRNATHLDSFRCSLPVYERHEEIVQLIRDNRVVLVVGETGSGKTTQIPQFLLDDCTKNGESCQIFCTQPRRLAAIAVAERVAAERGESVGLTVGYHIRLESRVSPMTRLTFCTSGVFLRTLMSGDAVLNTVTHVIVDEVHERDGLADFILTKMRDVLQTVPTLKLILSSAALDVDLFQKYFGSCPILHIKGRLFDVKELFLEDVLKLTGYEIKDMKRNQEETREKETKQKALTEWCKAVESSCVESLNLTDSASQQSLTDTENSKTDMNSPDLQPWLITEMDMCISNVFLGEDQDAFTQIFNLILYEKVNVDYTHSQTGATALMVAAGRGCIAQMLQLLKMGANKNLRAYNGWSPLDFALHFNQMEAVDLIKSSIPPEGAGQSEECALVPSSNAELSPEDKELLNLYHHSFDDEFVDLNLIMSLLHYICSTTDEGAVLIFLPGYDEIVTLRDRILYDDKRFSTHTERYQVYTLHSDMQASDQKKAMRASPPGVRKIILSTNIAETSITINDVIFVIDSGKVKEKSHDSLSHVSMLKSVWISRASALQRKGRAGRCRPGTCFHIFSRLRFNNMQEFQVPQLLRMPLQELCLQTKLLAPTSCQVEEFLSKAPQPPPAHAVRNAVLMLKTIDALDQHERLTDLGYHLADLPVEPHLGKMVLCAVVLKCLDPILTIACTLAYRDPFVLPAQGSQKKASLHCRQRFTAGTFSDHMALLRVFQEWQRACNEGCGRAFCEKNFLSQPTMEMILGMRTQLLRQLRAIGFVRPRGCSDIREVNMNSENWAVVKAALVAGMFPNIVHINKKNSVMSSKKEKRVHFHPTSVLCHSQSNESTSSKVGRGLPTDWLIYDEMSRGNRMASVRCCSVVTPVTIALFGGGANLPSSILHEPAKVQDCLRDESDSDSGSDSDSEGFTIMKLDDWLIFQLNTDAAGLIFQLRQKWQNVFIKRIKCPSKPWSQQDEAVIQTLVSVLSAEEQRAGLLQPTGIGQRPRPVKSEEDSQLPFKNRTNNPQTPDTDDRAYRMPYNSGHRGAVVNEEVSLAVNPLSEPLSSSNSSLCVSLESPGTFSPKHSSPTSTALAISSIRYFIMNGNRRNIEISQQKGIWSTTPSNESVLTKAFHSNKLIILIFSIQGSGQFQGYARMTAVGRGGCQDQGLMGLSRVFSVEWIHKESLPFHYTQHIMNPWNDNKKVQISRDGQELEPQTGNQLLLLWGRGFGQKKY